MGRANGKRRNHRKNRMNPIQKKGFLEQEIPLNNSEAALPLLSRVCLNF